VAVSDWLPVVEPVVPEVPDVELPEPPVVLCAKAGIDASARTAIEVGINFFIFISPALSTVVHKRSASTAPEFASSSLAGNA
jgi:hypothetical protein